MRKVLTIRNVHKRLPSKMIRVMILLLGLIVSVNVAKSQITADFTTNDDTTSCTSFLVQFINQSTGTGTLTYSWDFGAAGTSSEENPEILFNAPGSYTVKLVVTNGSVSDSLIKVNYIVYYNKPTANFQNTSTTLGCIPLTVSFEDLSTPGDGSINGWLWSFGDGQTDTLANTQNTYTTANDYTVSLQVFDDNGCEDFITKVDYINAVAKPAANFTANQTATCLNSIDVEFTNYSSGYGTLDYSWDFGDGQSSNEINPIHTYSGINTFDVELVVVDDNECTDTLLREDYIQLAEINAAFILESDTICPNENIPLTNNTSGASAFFWDFGDGTNLYDEFPEHAYTDSGQYIISLEVFAGAECTDSYSDTVYVEYVKAGFVSSPGYACQVPVDVNYTNQSENAVSYEWYFGDGTMSVDENPVHTFSLTPALELYNEVSYTDTLYAISEKGCRSKHFITQNLEIILPQAKIFPNNDDTGSPDLLEGCSPLTVNFFDTSSFDSPFENIASFQWDFGDGNASDQPDVSHTFLDAGQFTVEFVVTTDSGCTDTTTALVKVGESPVANFSLLSNPSSCASEPVLFQDLSTISSGEINGWQWYFSDDLTAVEQNPSHVFLDTGYMSVTLVAVYNGCPSPEFTIDSVVRILGPVATFSESVDCSAPTNFSFIGNIQGEEKFYWDFGDNTSLDSVNKFPDHTYSAGGEYTVTLTANNYTNSCEYISEKTLGVKNIQAIYTKDKNFGCEKTQVTFDADGSTDFFTYDIQGTTGSFLWNFGDGSPQLFTEDTLVDHIFKQRGEYTVSLIVKDVNECYDTLKSSVKIYEPVAGFTQDTNIGCIPLTVNFTDTTLSDTTITLRNWYFGENVFGNQANETYVYNNIGTYTVYLEVENIIGCNDTITKSNFITATKPIPEFSASDLTVCIGDTVYFTNESEDDFSSIFWDFHDGGTSSLENPFHVFADSGYHNVSLQVFDVLGCDSTLTKNNYIHVQSAPVVDFSTNITEASCYPALVNFNDITQHPYKSEWLWNFGLGQGNSVLQNPSYNYTIPGSFSISLTVGTTYGCSATITKDNLINIGGPIAGIEMSDTTCPGVNQQFVIENPENVFSTRWQFGGGELVNLGDTAFHTFFYGDSNTVTLYMFSEDESCVKDTTKSIFIYNFSAGFAINDSIGCLPYAVEITDTSIGATEWLWEFGEGTMSSEQEPQFIYNNIGSYLLRQVVLNAFNCIDTAQQNVYIYPLPIIDILNSDTLICIDDAISIQAIGGSTYNWQPDYEIDDNSLSAPSMSPKLNTRYVVMGTDTNGCSSTDSIFISVQHRPVIDSISVDTTVVVGETVQLGAHYTSGLTFWWSPNVNISDTSDLYPEVLLEDDAIYTFNVVDSNSCFQITRDVNVDVLFEYSVAVPTAFTPNNDGVNDIITVNGWGVMNLVEFKIYDRQGQLVYETNDITAGWDGTYQGKDMPVDTYVYTVIVESYDGELRNGKGSFRLIR